MGFKNGDGVKEESRWDNFPLLYKQHTNIFPTWLLTRVQGVYR